MSGSEAVTAPALGESTQKRPCGGVLFPQHYAWFVLAGSLDIMVTHAILHHFGGEEVNRIADALIQRFGVVGMVGLKYASTILVVGICEYVGRRNIRLGRRLAVIAIGLSTLPVGVGLLKVWQWTHAPMPIICPESTEEKPAYIRTAEHLAGCRPIPEADISPTGSTVGGSTLRSWLRSW
ncbi:MAG: DUF5658 family protein [Phycisphaerales bacterium]